MIADPLADFLSQLGRSSVQASVLAAVIWLVCRLLGSHLAARWRCRLWLLVIIRLALPFSLPSPVSIFNLFVAPQRLARPEGVTFWLPDELSSQAVRWIEQPWVCWTWLGVASALLLRVIIGWSWTVWLRYTARPLDSWEAWWLLNKCKEVLGLQTPVAILESSKIRSPCLLGFFHPRLVLPVGLVHELTPYQLRLVFLHELAHLQRRDIALNWLLAAVETLHWFNPLAWLVTRSLRAGREEACDACALADQPQAHRVYGETLIKLLERVSSEMAPPASPAMASLLGDGQDDLEPLVHRMRAIATFRPGHRTWVVGFCTWLALACIGLTDAEPRVSPEGTEVPVACHPLPPAGVPAVVVG
ncbi:MAG TPA: M56 family metallopeptidase [Candidatus Limnocylindria bacterium]|jgi:bla regulator protein BlaR1|nr:M56 family metallopeptidase [Candidatus Limnocylindria bacterium]